MRCFILAGGRSSRFGRDKAGEVLEGRALICHVADAARPHVEEITVVADVPGKYMHLGFNTFADDDPGKGPLGALCTALSLLRNTEYALVLSCDLIGLESEWIACLVKEAEAASRPVCLFDTNPMQPLIACYHASLLNLARQRLASGQASMHGLLSSVPTKLIVPPQGWNKLVNVNSIEDVAFAQSLGSL